MPEGAVPAQYFAYLQQTGLQLLRMVCLARARFLPAARLPQGKPDERSEQHARQAQYHERQSPLKMIVQPTRPEKSNDATERSAQSVQCRSARTFRAREIIGNERHGRRDAPR